DTSQIAGSGKDGRVTKGDLLSHSNGTPSSAPRVSAPPVVASVPSREGERRVPMSNLRARIAERLVQAQHTAAILTTFNEADMSAVMQLRAKHKESFKAKHGVNVVFMSFVTKAVIAALKQIPEVNGTIDGRDVIYRDYFDI